MTSARADLRGPHKLGSFMSKMTKVTTLLRSQYLAKDEPCNCLAADRRNLHHPGISSDIAEEACMQV